MKLSLDSLRLLDAIARRGTFASAAEELHVVASAVTHAVRKLEESLGLTLFDRSGRRARFTREGRLLLDKGRALLAGATALEHEVSALTTGWEPSLVISVDAVLRSEALLPHCAAFFEQQPATSLRLRLESLSGTWDALLSGRADLLIGASPNRPRGGGYKTQTLGLIEFVFAVAPGHPLANVKRPLSRRALAAHRAVVVSDTAQALPLQSFGVQPEQQRFAVADMQTKLQAQLFGIGCGFVPKRLAAPHLAAGRLREVPVQSPRPPERMDIAWRAGDSGRALRWWIDRMARRAVAEQILP